MKTDRSKPYFSEPDPSRWTKFVWDREVARLVDQTTSTRFQISSSALMETAGRAIAKVAIDRGAESHPVIVLCGKGNNGGDGLVAARVLHDHGAVVKVVIVCEANKNQTPLFTQQMATIQEMGVTTTNWRPGTLAALGLSRPIIIDAISGIGFKSPCSGVMSEALAEASKIQAATVIAVDLPSGLSSDDGTITKAPLPAHETVTFGSSRPIHRLMPSAACCGNVTVADIGFPKEAARVALAQRPAIWREIEPHEILHVDPWHALPKSAHKYDRGHVLVIGGSAGKIGAPIMTGLAALRSGAGWCTLAIPRGEHPVDMPIPMELTVEGFFDGAKIDAAALEKFAVERRVNTIVIGPGVMKQCLDAFSLKFLRDFAINGGTVILDAGALHDIAPLISKQGPLPPHHFILTPHHGEWLKIAESNTLPPLTPGGVESANQLAAELGTHMIYKNAAPVIVSPDKSAPIICFSGTNSLSRAGSGDLLAGIMAAHLAIGCSMSFAAARSYTLLSRAACIAAQDVGEDAVIASDILSRLGIAGRM
jgi:NAD(P)H-hydrate epimerase